MDYPLYEEMVRLGSRGRWFWRIGNWLSYAGLIGMVSVLILWPLMFIIRLGDAGFAFVLALVLMTGVFLAGKLLKRISYWLAEREGIDVPKYLEKPGDESKKPEAA